MSTSKLKNIVIIILAVLNACFIVLIIMNKRDSGNVEANEKKEIVELFKNNGIDIDINDIPDDVKGQSYNVVRDTQAEQNIVYELLGDASAEDRGGSIYYYENQNGSAVFRSNGEFEINFANIDDTQGASKTMEKLLRRIGIDFAATDSGTEELGDSRSITYNCTWQNTEVINCSVNLTIYAGGSAKLSGRRINGTPQETGNEETLDVSTFLVHVLNEIRAGGYVCDTIESVTLYYTLDSSVSSTKLSPIWKIETNSGEYLADAYNGKISLA